MEWSQPELLGEVVSARAGQAGATIGENWYIVGGGDNKSGRKAITLYDGFKLGIFFRLLYMSMNFAIGALETLVLNMSTLVWSVVSRVKGRDPLASEVINSICSLFSFPLYIWNARLLHRFFLCILRGTNNNFTCMKEGTLICFLFQGLSLCSTSVDGINLLVAFGGYNGNYHNEVLESCKQPRRTSYRVCILEKDLYLLFATYSVCRSKPKVIFRNLNIAFS